MPSRRDMLKSSLALAAGAVGLGAAGQALRQGKPAATTTATDRSPATLTLLGRGWHALREDRASGPPAAGDRTHLYGELTDGDGTRVGEFFGSATHLDSPFDQGGRTGTSVQSHTFRLREGTIHGMGTMAPGEDGDAVFAVVGGTGRYHGARGSYVARQQPVEFGGDGSAAFTLTFTS
jgi:Allene oxide cyclase barrel like domain